MADEIRVPPEVLDTFLKIKHLVDHTVEQLQALPPLQLSASGTGSSTGSASLTVVGAPSVSATARPKTVKAKASIPTPTVTVTEEEVEVARKWIFTYSAAVSAAATIAF